MTIVLQNLLKESC